MMNKRAYIGADIFDGSIYHANSALLTDGNIVVGIEPLDNIPAGMSMVNLNGGLLTPGFIDLQVNGGGGALFNDDPTMQSIETICSTHANFGTTALLPTLITDQQDVMKQAVEAGIEAFENNVPGFQGLHFEGPHLSNERNGAHQQRFIRPMSDKDVVLLCETRKLLPNLMVTVAPEAVANDQITELTQAGICISLGHTNTSAECAASSFRAGARAVTHLYNAMSGLNHREIGLVGAALVAENIFAGLIADGHHVSPEAITIAFRAKAKSTKLFLVTDAMSTVGTAQEQFELNGRKIERKAGKLTLEDGTLAGADLDMITAVKFMAANTPIPFEETLKMASLYPAQCLGIESNHGRLAQGSNANFVHLDDAHNIQGVWINGENMER